MDKIKAFFNSLYGILTLLLGVVFAIMLYVVDKKTREIRSLKTKAKLSETKEEVKLLENDIKHIEKNRKLYQTEKDSIEEAKKILAEKKAALKKKGKEKSPKEIEDYWKFN